MRIVRKIGAWVVVGIAALVLVLFAMPTYRQGEASIAGKTAQDFPLEVWGKLWHPRVSGHLRYRPAWKNPAKVLRASAVGFPGHAGVLRRRPRTNLRTKFKKNPTQRRKERRGAAERQQKNACPLFLAFDIRCEVRLCVGTFLFVAEGFDGVELGGLHGGEPATDHA